MNRSSFFSAETTVTARHGRAFTLVELLTVIAILGILAAILIPVVGRARSSAQATQCISNLRETGKALSLYAAENKNRIPSAQFNTTDHATWTRAILAWKDNSTVVDPSYFNIFRCPSTEEPVFDPDTGSIYTTYGMLHGAGQFAGYDITTWISTADGYHYLNRVPAPARIPLLMDTVLYTGSIQGRQWYYFYPLKTAENAGVQLRHGNRANTLFYDGHVQALSSSDLAKLGLANVVTADFVVQTPAP